MIRALHDLHDRIFSALEGAAERWFLGLLARLVFASVLFAYYFNSAFTKVHDGVFGFFSLADNAYYQILPPVIEAANYDSSNIALFPWKIVVYLGTYSEFLLPVLVVLGLFTRLASLAMIAFVAVQSFVDIAYHDIGSEAVGAMFDRFPDALILDQRLLWIFPLVYLTLKGAGILSLDALLSRSWQNRAGFGNKNGGQYARHSNPENPLI